MMMLKTSQRTGIGGLDDVSKRRNRCQMRFKVRINVGEHDSLKKNQITTRAVEALDGFDTEWNGRSEQVPKPTEDKCLENGVSVENEKLSSLDPELISRLRRQCLNITSEIKIGRRGVAPGIVHQIGNRWRTNEIVKIRSHGRHAANMKKLAEDLEKKTEGIIIHRTGSVIYIWHGHIPKAVS